MRINKLLVTLAFSMLFGSGVAVAADFDKGMMANIVGDFKTALAEWTPLAEQGDTRAQFRLGTMYEWGQGVLKNDKTAVKWYTLAAEQGGAEGQTALAFMFGEGQGVLENDKTAVKWYIKAAEQGYALAQSYLGSNYQFGEGVPKDNRRAYMWYSLSSYNGHWSADNSKKWIAKRMTPADISKAQDMSSLCLESNYTDC